MTAYTKTIQLDQPLLPGDTLSLVVAAPAIPVPVPVPVPTPVPAPAPFRLGVGLIQGCSKADALPLADRAGLVGAVHMVAFGGNSTGSDADSRVKWFGPAVPVMLHAAIAPSDLSLTGKAYDAGTRLKDVAAARTFADHVAAVVNANPNVFAVTFTNEWKGYYTTGTPGSWDGPTFVAHYVAFAQELRAKTTRHVDILGPYTTGQHNQNVLEGLDERVRYCHDQFISGVCKPHPELVDGICWDDGNGGNHKSYTDYYAKRGLGALRHWDVETYPGGWNAASVTDATVIAETKSMMANPAMAGSLIWGPGRRPDVTNSESAQAALLWDSHQVRSALWKSLIAL